jgi:phthalate 4,5-dioxygenase oxygenase subunit
MIRAALTLQETGVVPPSVDDAGVYAQRSGGVVIPATADWLDATKELRQAFVHHTPEEIQASLGRDAQKTTAG